MATKFPQFWEVPEDYLEDTIHKDLKEYRKELNRIFEMAKPLLQYMDLCKQIREESEKLAKKLRSASHHPEMCSCQCPESDHCPEEVDGKCPKFKSDYVGFWYGTKSFYDLERLVPDLNYAIQKKSYEK